MTEPPAGWTSPSGETSPPYGAPPPGYGPPPTDAPAGYAGPPGGWYGGPPPAPAPGVVPLRPLTVGELLDGAVKIIRRYPRPTLGLSAVVAAVTTLLNVVALLFVDLSGEVAALNDESASGDVTVNAGSSAASIPGALVGVPAGIFLTGVLVAVVGRAVLGREATLAEMWAEVRPRLWSLLGLALLTGLLIGAPLLLVGLLFALAFVAGAGDGALVGVGLLALPALGATAYLYGRLSLAPAVLVLERSGIRTALRRSGALVTGSWWRVFGILLLTQVIASLVTQVLVVPVALIGGFTLLSDATTSDYALFLVISQVLGGVASWLVSPFTAGVRALLYVDRRMRAEALDLTLQAAARA